MNVWETICRKIHIQAHAKFCILFQGVHEHSASTHRPQEHSFYRTAIFHVKKGSSFDPVPQRQVGISHLGIW